MLNSEHKDLPLGVPPLNNSFLSDYLYDLAVSYSKMGDLQGEIRQEKTVLFPSLLCPADEGVTQDQGGRFPALAELQRVKRWLNEMLAEALDYPPLFSMVKEDILSLLNSGPGGELYLDADIVARLTLASNYAWVPRLPKNADSRVVIVNGMRYRPVPDAAAVAQVPRQTFLNWIKNQTEVGGAPLRTIFLRGVNRYMVDELSIIQATDRFVQLPQGERARGVYIGSKPDRSGYIAMKEAAQRLRIAKPTITLWAGDYKKSPTKSALDVIKCTASGQLYIRESELDRLAAHVPDTGLSRGRRPQLAVE